MTKPRLTAAQVQQFKTEGYFIPQEHVFGQAKFEGLKNHFEGKLARLADDERPENMDVPHFTDKKLFDWLFADEVLDLVEPIIGPDIILFSSHFICKPRGNGKRVPWHEDSYYWKGMMQPFEICTVWLAVDPSTRVNGCMKVIPRTLGGFSEYDPVDPEKNVFNTEIKASMRDETKQVYIELQQGQASLHDARLMHGSDPNTSNIRRCGYTMRYMPAHVKFNDDYAGSWHQIYLARGKDKAGNKFADPTKEYPSMAKFREKSGRKGH